MASPGSFSCYPYDMKSPANSKRKKQTRKSKPRQQLSSDKVWVAMSAALWVTACFLPAFTSTAGPFEQIYGFDAFLKGFLTLLNPFSQLFVAWLANFLWGGFISVTLAKGRAEAGIVLGIAGFICASFILLPITTPYVFAYSSETRSAQLDIGGIMWVAAITLPVLPALVRRYRQIVQERVAGA